MQLGNTGGYGKENGGTLLYDKFNFQIKMVQQFVFDCLFHAHLHAATDYVNTDLPSKKSFSMYFILILFAMALIYHCSIESCTKNCKSCSGLTQHLNTFHRQQSPVLSNSSELNTTL